MTNEHLAKILYEMHCKYTNQTIQEFNKLDDNTKYIWTSISSTAKQLTNKIELSENYYYRQHLTKYFNLTLENLDAILHTFDMSKEYKITCNINKITDKLESITVREQNTILVSKSLTEDVSVFTETTLVTLLDYLLPNVIVYINKTLTSEELLNYYTNFNYLTCLGN